MGKFVAMALIIAAVVVTGVAALGDLEGGVTSVSKDAKVTMEKAIKGQ